MTSTSKTNLVLVLMAGILAVLCVLSIVEK